MELKLSICTLALFLLTFPSLFTVSPQHRIHQHKNTRIKFKRSVMRLFHLWGGLGALASHMVKETTNVQEFLDPWVHPKYAWLVNSEFCQLIDDPMTLKLISSIIASTSNTCKLAQCAVAPVIMIEVPSNSVSAVTMSNPMLPRITTWQSTRNLAPESIASRQMAVAEATCQHCSLASSKLLIRLGRLTSSILIRITWDLSFGRDGFVFGPD